MDRQTQLLVLVVRMLGIIAALLAKSLNNGKHELEVSADIKSIVDEAKKIRTS